MTNKPLNKEDFKKLQEGTVEGLGVKAMRNKLCLVRDVRSALEGAEKEIEKDVEGAKRAHIACGGDLLKCVIEAHERDLEKLQKWLGAVKK